MPNIVPNLWFDTQALEAAEFYTSIFPDSEIRGVTHYAEGGLGEPGSVMTVDFTLDGQRFTAINGGPQFPFTEAVSLLVDCPTQDDIDHYWERLGDGGEGVQCGWLKDRYGLSWQIAPADFGALVPDDDPDAFARVMQAMMPMVKLDLATLRAAADG